MIAQFISLTLHINRSLFIVHKKSRFIALLELRSLHTVMFIILSLTCALVVFAQGTSLPSMIYDISDHQHLQIESDPCCSSDNSVKWFKKDTGNRIQIKFCHSENPGPCKG